MKEIWKDVTGFEGIYKVSNKGNVINIKRNKLLKQESTKGGYKRVILQHNGIVKRFQTHRLVALEFLQNPYGYPCVNHKDENKENNCVENLEWCTYSYNINYGSRNFLCMKKARSVNQMDFEGNILATYCSINFAARLMKVDPSNIYKCCRGQISYAYDYKWAFA